MALTPEINNQEVNIDGGIEKVSYPTTSFLYNESTGMTELSYDNLALIGQDIDAMLSIERYTYVIYTANAGIETVDLPGQDLGIIINQLQARIKDTFSVDDRILGISNFSYEKLDKKSVKVKFIVNTIYGNIEKEITVEI